MRNNRRGKGFTMMEMLVVVAVIAVLVAIAIPVLSKQLEKSREAADIANIRSAYAEVMIQVLEEDEADPEKSVDLKQTENGWADANAGNALKKTVGEENVIGEPQGGGKATVKWEEGKAYILFEGALPVIINEDDYNDPVKMSRAYADIVSYLAKNYPMNRLRSRYDYCGQGATDEEKVKIYTVQTGDGQTQAEIKEAMKTTGYSDNEINTIYTGVKYAYLDKDGNVLGYHGAGSGGQTKLYIVGYDSNPVNVGGAVEAREKLAEFVQSKQ